MIKPRRLSPIALFASTATKEESIPPLRPTTTPFAPDSFTFPFIHVEIFAASSIKLITSCSRKQ
jgi:hypothetical protein